MQNPIKRGKIIASFGRFIYKRYVRVFISAPGTKYL